MFLGTASRGQARLPCPCAGGQPVNKAADTELYARQRSVCAAICNRLQVLALEPENAQLWARARFVTQLELVRAHAGSRSLEVASVGDVVASDIERLLDALASSPEF